ncbi:MAG: hypothetical protein ACLFOY_04425 [Desulfatibacillaceae bacterium]
MGNHDRKCVDLTFSGVLKNGAVHRFPTLESRRGHLLPLILSVLALLALVAGTPAPGHAGRLSLAPSLGTGVGYDSNPFWQRDPDNAGVFLRIKPRLEASWREERWKLDSAVGARVLHYFEDDNLNREDVYGTLGVKLHATECLRLNAHVKAFRENTLDSELAEVGVVRVYSEKVRLVGGGGFEWDMFPRTVGVGSYSHTDVGYDSDNLRDHTSQSASFLVSHRLKTRRDTLLGKAAYTRYDSSASLVDNGSLYAGWNRDLSASWSVESLFGVRLTNRQVFRFEPATNSVVEAHELDWGGLANVTVYYSGEEDEASLGYSRDLSYTSGGYPINRDVLRGSYRHQFTEDLAVGISSGVYRTKYDSDANQPDGVSYNIEPWASWRFNAADTLKLSYRYWKGDRDGQGLDRTRHEILLQWQYHPGAWTP